MEQQVDALAELDGPQLRQRWKDMTGQAAPSVSSKLLRLALACHLQAKAFGDLPASARRELAQIAKGKRSQPIRTGMRLVRESHGITYVATVDEAGRVVWNRRKWTSLSAVARAITGQQWSGPTFFGLRKAAPHEADPLRDLHP